MSYEDYIATKNRKFAYVRAKKLRDYPCPKCHLHLCICQSILKDFGV